MNLDMSVVAFGLPILLRGLMSTIALCGVSLLLGLVLAICIALMRLSRRAYLRYPAIWFVEVIRNTPFLVQAFIVYYALPSLGIRIDAISAGILVLTMYGGAYFAESIRGAILSVPKGQMEAARAVGMPYLKSMRRIIAPQMLGYLIPSLTNQMIGVIKESALLSIITVPELTHAGQVVLGESFSPVETYLMVGLLYWALTALVAAGMMRLERLHHVARREKTAEIGREL